MRQRVPPVALAGVQEWYHTAFRGPPWPTGPAGRPTYPIPPQGSRRPVGSYPENKPLSLRAPGGQAREREGPSPACLQTLTVHFVWCRLVSRGPEEP